MAGRILNTPAQSYLEGVLPIFIPPEFGSPAVPLRAVRYPRSPVPLCHRPGTRWPGTSIDPLESLNSRRTPFPFNAKLCINGHEYLKRQLAREGIAFEALDNGILTCADPERMQQLSSALTAARIDALVRKWLGRLPHPFSSADRVAGLLYQVSILQAEFSLTQVLDRPLHGRAFFEDVIRENLDLGRPDHVQLIFDRRVNKRTPSRFRTRVITQGVVPSLHVDYKHSRIKQYHKEGRALRTESWSRKNGRRGRVCHGPRGGPARWRRKGVGSQRSSRPR